MFFRLFGLINYAANSKGFDEFKNVRTEATPAYSSGIICIVLIFALLESIQDY